MRIDAAIALNMNHELLSQAITFVGIGLLGQLKRKINDREMIMIKTIKKKKKKLPSLRPPQSALPQPA